MPHGCFLQGIKNNAVVHCTEEKFENYFGNKILTETKPSVGKHADKNSSLGFNKAND